MVKNIDMTNNYLLKLIKKRRHKNVSLNTVQDLKLSLNKHLFFAITSTLSMAQICLGR